MEPEQFNKGTHDLGFMMYCSFGNGLRLIREGALQQDAAPYDSILLTSARSLSTRFNPYVGCIKSWDSKPWHFPVIIDNMMNLELLFWASRISGDSSFYHIAVTHANTTMRNHYRPDYSSFHVVDYDSATGAIIAKKTAQGYADSSAWARGQAWGLYGYTMVYRATHDARYLAQAEHIAHFLLTNPKLPADKIPYWDYDAPGIPVVGGANGGPGGSLRDASAAAIMASALIELSHYVQPAEGRQYLDVAEQIIVTFSSNVVQTRRRIQRGALSSVTVLAICPHTLRSGCSAHLCRLLFCGSYATLQTTFAVAIFLIYFFYLISIFGPCQKRKRQEFARILEEYKMKLSKDKKASRLSCGYRYIH